jgi:hypothetical protein
VRTVADETAEQRRARILALSPEDRDVLAGLIRKQLGQIPGQLAKLIEDQAELIAWIAEFAPQMHVNCEHDPGRQDDGNSFIPFQCPDVRWNCCKAPGSGPHDSSCGNGSITAPNPPDGDS